MSIPKYNELYKPLLSVIQDGQTHSLKEVQGKVAAAISLSEPDQIAVLPSGQKIFYNRINWANTYLKKAGLIASPKRGYIEITAEGKSLFSSGVEITNKLLLANYPSFRRFQNREVENSTEKGTDAETENVALEETETPQETMERMYQALNDQLAEDLLEVILQQSPYFFEKLVVDLMRAMGYGEGFVTKSSGDDGIDGVIHEDKLGFNLIYIQAKRWRQGLSVGKPEIQKFVGAMMGPPRIEKGLFITTAQFSQGAKEYAKAQHIILVDGKRLTKLMIEHDLGVSNQKIYRLKKIDSDYFADGE